MPPKSLLRQSSCKKESRAAAAPPANPSRAVLTAQQFVQTAAPKPVARAIVAPAKAPARGRNEAELYFERLRAMDRLEGKDALGAKGISQLCRDIGISVGSFEMYVLIWKIGTTQSGCVPRTDWISAMYAYRIENPMDLRVKIPVWVKEVKSTDFVEFYSDLYDYARSADARLMPYDTAVNLWRILFTEEPQIMLWVEWYSSVYKQDVSRDVWIQLPAFFESVPEMNNYNIEDKWPIAIDKYVEWRRKPK